MNTIHTKEIASTLGVLLILGFIFNRFVQTNKSEKPKVDTPIDTITTIPLDERTINETTITAELSQANKPVCCPKPAASVTN